MGVRLSEKEIYNRLGNRKIKLVDYNNFRNRGYDWECIVKDCNYKWFAALRHIINDNSGCPKCAGNIKLTNEYIDNKLIGRNIRRLENYTNINDQILWGCLVGRCQHKWKTTTCSVINYETGCPKCACIIKITNNDIDNRLIERNIKRLGDISNLTMNTRMAWQCLIENCNHTWSATTNSIIGNKKTGCPKCVGCIKLTNEIVDKKLIGRNIKRISKIINAKHLTSWLCLIEECNYCWETSPDCIINKHTGCPKCAGKVKLTNDIVDLKLIGRNIKRLSDIVNAKTKNSWLCLIENCNHIWSSTPASILNRQTGCPKCSCLGQNEKLIYNILIQFNIDIKYQYCIKNINDRERALRFDFYFPKKKIAIEYNGKQHYEPVGFGCKDIKKIEDNFISQQERDTHKRNFCKKEEINLIEIDGRKIYGEKLKKHIYKIIKEFL